MRFSKDPSEIGNKLGPRLVELISQTVAATHYKLLDTNVRARTMSSQAIIDRAGHEIADLFRPVMTEMLKDVDLPDYLQEYIDKTLAGTHQWHSIAGMVANYSGGASALSTIMSNYLAPTVQALVSRAPFLVTSPESLATLIAKGVLSPEAGYPMAAGQGYNTFMMDQLVEGNMQYPDLSTALDMLNRGLASSDDLETFLSRNGIPPRWHVALMRLADTVLSPADLADMVVRGILDQGAASVEARKSGVTPEDFGLMVLDTGEPLALMQLLEAYRRKFIDQATLERGIRQSRIRDEWIPVATQLRYSPMSVADAVNAVVQNHMDQATAENIAEQNGLEPGALDTLIQTAGEPLSRTELEQLYNRGLITEAEVTQGLRESRLKDKYLGAAFQLHTKLPPIYTLQHAVRYGGVDIGYAVQQTMAQGYSQTDAEIIVNASQGEKLQTTKDKTISAVEAMIEANLISESDAGTVILSLGYTDQETGFILQTADFRRQAKAITQVVASVRARYIAHHIDTNTASGLLDAAGLPATQRDYNIELWNIELEANVRQLTPAQIAKAFKLGLIDQQTALDRMVLLGYNEDDAALILQGA